MGRLREGSAENAPSRVSHRRGSRFKRAAQAFFASQPARCCAASKEKCECEEMGLWLGHHFLPGSWERKDKLAF